MTDYSEILDPGFDANEEARRKAFYQDQQSLSATIERLLIDIRNTPGVMNLEVESNPSGLVLVTAHVRFFITADTTRGLSVTEINWDKAASTNDRLYKCLLGVQWMVGIITDSACVEGKWKDGPNTQLLNQWTITNSSLRPTRNELIQSPISFSSKRTT